MSTLRDLPSRLICTKLSMTCIPGNHPTAAHGEEKLEINQIKFKKINSDSFFVILVSFSVYYMFMTFTCISKRKKEKNLKVDQSICGLLPSCSQLLLLKKHGAFIFPIQALWAESCHSHASVCVDYHSIYLRLHKGSICMRFSEFSLHL